MAGITEATEFIDGWFAFLGAVREASRDGISVRDLLAVVADGPVKDAVIAAAVGAEQIGGELGDLDRAELIALVRHFAAKVEGEVA